MFRVKDRQRCQQIFEKHYAGRKFHNALYRGRMRKYRQPGQRLLDAGCGRYLKVCKGLSDVARVVGIDLETTLETDNHGVPFGARGDLSSLCFSSSCFDMVMSRSVVEHSEDPPQVFREFSRVLRLGRKLVIITPNKCDYFSLIAAATPYLLHWALVSRIFQVPEDDVFQTLYRANTISSIQKALRSADFVQRELGTVNHCPAYLMLSRILFHLGILHEKLASLGRLRSLRGSILGVFEKQDEIGTTGFGQNTPQRLTTQQNVPMGVS
jgi:ubiquinone/menaquinone biosynthesis C-methylase UbiE